MKTSFYTTLLLIVISSCNSNKEETNNRLTSQKDSVKINVDSKYKNDGFDVQTDTIGFRVIIDTLVANENEYYRCHIKTISVYTKDSNKLFQTIIPPANRIYCSMPTKDIIQLQDMNFDGWTDFSMRYGYRWIFNNATQQFQRDTLLEKIDSPQFDYQQKLITSYRGNRSSDQGVRSYKYINGKLTLVEECDVAFHNVDYPGKVVTTKKQLINEKMKLVERTIDFIVRKGSSGIYGSGIYLYRNIDPSMHYYVFSKSGNAIVRSSHFKKEVHDQCGDELIAYHLEPTVVLNRSLYNEFHSHYSLVVGSKDDIQFIPPVLIDITEEQKRICISFTKIDTSQCHHVRFYSMGYKNNKHRIYYEYCGAFAIVEFDENNKLNVLYEGYGSNDNYDVFCGQADLNFDGFCETILLDFGDYGGKWILKNTICGWKLFDASDGLGTC